MNMHNTLTIGSIVLLLTACGGGDGGGGGSTSTPPPATPAAPTTMEDLVVPDGFDYNPVGSYKMSIDISNTTTERAFVSVYSRYNTRSDNTLKPDYSSKVVASSLANGKLDLNFSAPNVNENLLIEIWFYNGQDPLQRTFSTSQSQITW
ncbi:hypothetical protein [Vibrio profundi]|uniref:hypothetical protein n=1 Tax=Vibrio profundi TaxID=1774960 RepID=UPI003736083D